jgi:hypothetical protein
VLILKVVKVLCFDTLLQVLILKVDRGGRRNRREERTKATAKDNAETAEVAELSQRYPPPGCFGKRGCKLLKTKDASRKLKTKRLQAIERTRVRVGVAGGVSEVGS